MSERDWIQSVLSAVGLLGVSDAADVLVVEETPGSSADLAELLGPLGQRLHRATGATQACLLAKQIQPALIVLDASGPVSDSLELCRRLKQADELEHVPVIMCLTRALPEQRVAALCAGAAEMIPHPLPP